MGFGAYSGHLATVTTLAENQFLMSTFNLSTRQAWIGLSDSAVEGTFRWVTGPETWLTPPSGMWASSEPNNKPRGLEDEDCVAFWDTGGWNDEPCSSLIVEFFIVEYERKLCLCYRLLGLSLPSVPRSDAV
jgi:hypothetical protein